LFLLIAAIVLLAAAFAYTNPGLITVDVGVARLEDVSMSLAFASAFGLGWLFGLACAALALLRMARERRRLRRDLRYAETELSTLRSLPLRDAD
jgi:uncharacterized membrane protein YciS (DUF1049 family)